MAVAVKEMGMSSVRSPASSAYRGTTAANLHMLVAAVEASDIFVPERTPTALARLRAWCSLGEHDGASWASRFDPADIDAEVLRWIASQARGKRPLAC
jgi:hypothetical protein